jgi:hypothetical protein
LNHVISIILNILEIFAYSFFIDNVKSNGQTNESEAQGEESFDDKVKDKLTEINARYFNS